MHIRLSNNSALVLVEVCVCVGWGEKKTFTNKLTRQTSTFQLQLF